MEESPETKPKFQFSIAHMLVFTAIVAASLAPVAIWGFESLFVSFLLALLLILLWFKKFAIVGCLFALSILVGMLLPPIGGYSRRPARRSMCSNNLKQLGMACLNFQSANGHYPPAFSTDENGNPLHSWRVLLLPYIEQQALYDDLDLTKPWHHPDNLKHAHRMPDAFKCPSHEPDSEDRFADVMTSYVCVIGKETIWQPDGKLVRYEDITDGSSNTILFVESDTHQSHWMAPNDPHFDEVHPMDEQETTDLIQSHHNGGSTVSYADGTVYFLPEDIPVKALRAKLTKSGDDIEDALDW